MKVDIKNTTQEYEGFFTLEKSQLRFEKFDGTMSDDVVRENFYRGDSVAALIYDASAELALFIQQFRYPVYTVAPEEAWILELVAGSRDRSEDPRQSMLRELQEEVHLQASVEQLDEIGVFFVSPGGTSERIYLYALNTDLSDYQEDQGGLISENEDIRIRLLSFEQMFELLSTNRLIDAKSIIGVQWLQLQVAKKIRTK